MMTAAERIPVDLLVVDDEPALRRALQLVLTSEGYRVTLAEHGQDALAKLAPGCDLPACIVTDWAMPVMDGRQLLAALQGDPRLAAIPILILSGSLESRHVPVGCAMLHKPFDASELFAKVRIQIEGGGVK